MLDDYDVTGTSPMDDESTGNNNERERCPGEFLEGSAGTLRLIVGEWINLSDSWLRIS